MTWEYGEAGNGNVALTGELAGQSGTLVLSFAGTPEGARTLGRASLAEDYASVRQTFIEAWEKWGETIEIPYASPELRYQAELSAMVLKVHQDRTFAGSIIASLSVPWGNSHDSLGGYHLVWPRDAVQGALALMSIGQTQDAQRMLAYLVGTQAASGAWGQNYFPDGRSYWTGHQLDEVALPVVLVGKLRAAGAVIPSQPIEDMVRGAIGFIVRNGPMTDQDRWEENAGATPFTLAFAITALVAGSEFLDPDEEAYVLSLADCWNERIEAWIYTTDGPFCAQYGVDGYYVRIAPLPGDGGIEGIVPVRNRADGDIPAKALVSLDYLYLTRTGLRRADDPRMRNTLKITDGLLGKMTPSGMSYYRYNGDGYGEKADGAPYDGTGIGRPWPLLTGERGHFAACADEEPFAYLDAMVKMAGPGGLLPEQIWDEDAIPRFELEPGKPSGSAMPLVWAHSEFIKLLATGATGQPAERLNVVESRYGGIRPEAGTWHWRDTSPFTVMPAGRSLLIEASEPFTLRFGRDGWARPEDVDSRELPLGMHGIRFAPDRLKGMRKLVFTLHFTERGEWAGEDFAIAFEPRS